MCCTNDIPYSAAPSENEATALAVSGDYTPTKISNARDHGTTEIERAKEIIDFFLSKGKPIEFGIAVAGVWGAESGIKSWNYNRAEQSNGYAFKDKHAPNADKFTYGGKQYYKDAANMMKFGYGKGLAQWSWSRNLKFRDWYRSGADGKPTAGLSMDDWGANITGTSVTTQTAFAWKEMQERTGEFMTTVNGISHVSPVSNKQQFDQNIITGVDAVLRGFENGGNKSMASTKQIDKYTWDGGYKGAMKKRVERALGIYEKLKENGDYQQYLS